MEMSRQGEQKNVGVLSRLKEGSLGRARLKVKATSTRLRLPHLMGVSAGFDVCLRHNLRTPHAVASLRVTLVPTSTIQMDNQNAT